MQTLFILVVAAAARYLATGSWLCVRPCKLIYLPVAHDLDFDADPVSLDGGGVTLHGRGQNPGRESALVAQGSIRLGGAGGPDRDSGLIASAEHDREIPRLQSGPVSCGRRCAMSRLPTPRKTTFDLPA